ncbi:MAG: RNA 2'-phosphotransferase [Lentisphaeraceae bacterium]|nr:RNA 2'-phosphotransferase [Lentisphaeraceae bacterium]
MSKDLTKKHSKFMSLVLRHKPQEIGLELDEQGWAEVDQLLSKMQERGKKIDRALIEEIVANNDKKRFAFSEDGKKIRASQGHSLKLDLGLEEKEPPAMLYHGTATRNLSIIQSEGLKKMKRHHVHLSSETKTAMNVGSRYGKPVILKVNAGEMYRQGLKFYQSANGVWLTDFISVDYIDFSHL